MRIIYNSLMLNESIRYLVFYLYYKLIDKRCVVVVVIDKIILSFNFIEWIGDLCFFILYDWVICFFLDMGGWI